MKLLMQSNFLSKRLGGTKQVVPVTAPRLHHFSVSTSVPQRSSIIAAASSVPEQKPAIVKFAESIGLPTDEGFFGFNPFSELWCGRLAMMGFLCSIVEECVTGQGTLGQLGITETPSAPLLIGLLVLFGGATTAAVVWTAVRVAGRKMSKKELDRYRQFLGLKNDDDWKQEARAMKQRGDFTTPGVDLAAIEQAKQQGTAADQVLGVVVTSAEKQEARVSTAVLESSAPEPPSAREIEESLFTSDELKYARAVELDNGRWAMVGFLTAVLVEAGTGKGIVLQIIMYLKWSGLLGPLSGF